MSHWGLELTSLSSISAPPVQASIVTHCYDTGEGPSQEHELARFKLADNLRELWYFTRAELKKMNTESSRAMLEDFSHRHR